MDARSGDQTQARTGDHLFLRADKIKHGTEIIASSFDSLARARWPSAHGV
jgi:hypothetical protein